MAEKGVPAMPRYLIEVTHPEPVAAKRIDQSVRTFGSHFATHADWHHRDDVLTGTMVIEAADQWHALSVVPPGMRSAAHVFRLEAVDAELPAAVSVVPLAYAQAA
jgi:hypothetical protein